MTINVTIDLEDIWIDEESVNTAVEQRVKSEVINSIWKKVESKVDDQINRAVKLDVEKQYTKKISVFIDDFIKSGLLESSYDRNNKVTVEDWLKEQFQRNTNWNSPKDQIEKLAKRFGEEMKNKYDLMFASQIVIKLNEQGLLKDDIAKILIDNK